MTTNEFIREHRQDDVTQLALRIRQFPHVDAAFALQQIEGFQRAKSKLPTLAANENWHWPVRLSVEQCSSEQTALYKATILADILQPRSSHDDATLKPLSSNDEATLKSLSSHSQETLTTHSNDAQTTLNLRGLDLTGGLGIDTLFLSARWKEWHYVEMQSALTELAQHNFRALGCNNIAIHNCTAEDFLHSSDCPEHVDLIFIDPARRDQNGGKVFRLSDCTPDVCSLYDTLMQHADRLLLKLSPMLDISEALTHLPHATQVHIVALQGEVKEVLVVAEKKPSSGIQMVAVNLGKEQVERLAYQLDEEAAAEVTYCGQMPDECYLYEPNSAILKAGAFKLMSQQYGLKKLGANTHLYMSDTYKEFPGRVWRVHEASKEELKSLKQANILCRNYPLKPDELKKKLKIKDGGETYVIGCRVAQKATILIGERI